LVRYEQQQEAAEAEEEEAAETPLQQAMPKGF